MWSSLSVSVLVAAVSAQDFLFDQREEYNGTCNGRKLGALRCAADWPAREWGQSSTNIWSCGDIHEDGDNLAMLYDVRYNGSVTFSAGNTAGSCPPQSADSPYSYVLSIGNVGPIPGTNLSRTMWDQNPYWMNLDWASGGEEFSGETRGSLKVRSSTSWYIYPQAWTLRAEKTADGSGYDISGELSNYRYDGFQDFDYRFSCNGLWSGFGLSASWMIHSCNNDNLTMSGRITADSADVTYTMYTHIGEQTSGEPFQWHFVGSKVGAPELVLSEDAPTVTGVVDGADEVLEGSVFSDSSDGGGDGEPDAATGWGPVVWMVVVAPGLAVAAVCL